MVVGITGTFLSKISSRKFIIRPLFWGRVALKRSSNNFIRNLLRRIQYKNREGQAIIIDSLVTYCSHYRCESSIFLNTCWNTERVSFVTTRKCWFDVMSSFWERLPRVTAGRESCTTACAQNTINRSSMYIRINIEILQYNTLSVIVRVG